jgi:hypothetical protein
MVPANKKVIRIVEPPVHYYFIPGRTLLFQANYINALAVFVLPFFEPAGPTTLGKNFQKNM